MKVSALLEALDLRGTGAARGAELELEILRRDPDFERCKNEALLVLTWTIDAFLSIEEDERKAGERTEALASRRKEFEAARQRLADMPPANTAQR